VSSQIDANLDVLTLIRNERAEELSGINEKTADAGITYRAHYSLETYFLVGAGAEIEVALEYLGNAVPIFAQRTFYDWLLPSF